MLPNRSDCNQLDIELFLEMLNIDSTSGSERRFSDFLIHRLPFGDCKVTVYPADAPDGEPQNVLFAWGNPNIVFCTHLDTVPPYIPPTIETSNSNDTIIYGRGSCDAKGQIFAMYSACKYLAEHGAKDFGLLLLYGEETGSYGAKFQCQYPGAEYVIVGEPTDCRIVEASKGTKSFEVTIHGIPFHSGYPQYGNSAIERFVDLVNTLRKIDFPIDPILGKTTYNIGKLVSDNPQNILSSLLTCRIYFRTTFASDDMVKETMASLTDDVVEIKPLGGDNPMHYMTLPGFATTTVAFGSDAPQLFNYRHKMLCGPGSILVAHTSDEYITTQELLKSINMYISIFEDIQNLRK